MLELRGLINGLQLRENCIELKKEEKQFIRLKMWTRITCLCFQTPTRRRRKAAISPSSGRNAPVLPSRTRRCSSSSGASIISGTYPDRSARTSRPPSNSPRRRSRSGSRTDATKPNGVRWRRICWPRPRRRRKWPWKFWCVTTGGSTVPENCCDPRCSRCSPHIITRTRTACPRGAWTPVLETSDCRARAHIYSVNIWWLLRKTQSTQEIYLQKNLVPPGTVVSFNKHF